MLSMRSGLAIGIVLISVVTAPLFGARGDRYALVLEDAPAAKAVPHGTRPGTAVYESARATVRVKQAAVKSALTAQGFRVTGSADMLINAVFVMATRADLPKLKAIPGVKYVAFMPEMRKKLNTAVTLVDANPNGWNLVGGVSGAGAGIKIAILDTGIDQTHPAFQGTSLPMPAGFPKCDVTANCAYTNNKVIVARSYVSQLSSGDPATSAPDNISAEDFDGHGTSVAMAAAGNTATGPLGTITGLAPQAYLGNYKVYGSPGINDFSTGQTFINALEDAMSDGMDVINYSSGSAPFSGPSDTGSACGAPAGEACDPSVSAVETAIKTGNLIVVAAGGNEGDTGYQAGHNGPATFTTIGSPAYAPDVIATAATGNLHAFPFPYVEINGTNVSSTLQLLNSAESADGPQIIDILSAPLIDAGNVGDPYGCSAYPANVFLGDIALIERGAASGTACTFETKAINAGNSGALAVLFYDNTAEQVFAPDIVSSVIPAFLIDQADGQALKAYVDTTPGVTAALDAWGPPVDAGDVNQVTNFSSRGPVLGSYALKPDIAAPGENIYTAAENVDPDGELFDPSRFTAANGTSYSTPIISGLAALVRQSHPGWTATQVKSALVNTATADTTDPYVANSLASPSGVLSVGGGKADSAFSMETNVTAEPSTISYGELQPGSVNGVVPVVITNQSAGPLTLLLSVVRNVADANTQFTLDASTLTLAAGASQTVHVTLSGTQPVPGIYEGAVMVTGGAQALHIPYLYLVGDFVPFDFIQLAGTGETGTVGQVVPDGASVVQVLDQFGVAVSGLTVTWSAPDGGTIQSADPTTDAYGIAQAVTVLGSSPGTYTFNAKVQGIGTIPFSVNAAAVPTIGSGGVVNAATFQVGQGISPGSYVAIFGANLSPSTVSQYDYAYRIPLPVEIEGASVSFDATGVSAVGALNFAGPGQINAQVPWELAGASSVQMKVNINYGITNPSDDGYTTGALITVPVTTYSPAMFPYPDPNGTQVAAAVDLSGNVITSAHPAMRGDYISIYCNGLGPVSNTPADGYPGLASPLSETSATPIVTIGGQAGTVQFSGLTPGFVGLYQINVLVPTTISAGTQPVALTIGGVAAPTLNITVQ